MNAAGSLLRIERIMRDRIDGVTEVVNVTENDIEL